jgi:ligand-binding sensor domain-containing protein
VGERLLPYRFRRASEPGGWLADREVRANKLLRDRDGGLWIGSEGLGLIHVKDGQADTFTRAEGLSGNIACSLFEDREGNIWYGSERGIDRFRKLAIATLSKKQGLPDDVARSVVATADGSVWVATNDGMARWRDTSPVVFKESDGLPDAHVHSQYQDADGRLWVSTAKGLAYFANGRFVAVDGGPSNEIYAMTGDAAGNLWLSGNKGLAHLHRGRFVDNLTWASLGHEQQAQMIIADPARGGLWMSFWDGSGVSFFKDGRITATHNFAHKPGHGTVGGLRLDADGALWAATSASGLYRIKDGSVTRLSVENGLPCDITHWSVLDGRGALWLYTACGLVQLPPQELAAWVADPHHHVAPKLWGAADGVPLSVTPPGYYNPPGRPAPGRQAVVHRRGRAAGHRPCPHARQHGTTTGPRRGPGGRPTRPCGHPGPAPGATGARHPHRVLRPHPGRPEEHALPLPAGRPRRGLAGGHRPASSQLHQPGAGPLPLPGQGRQ